MMLHPNGSVLSDAYRAAGDRIGDGGFKITAADPAPVREASIRPVQTAVRWLSSTTACGVQIAP